MKVYCVLRMEQDGWDGVISSYELVRVFKTKDLAQTYIDKYPHLQDGSVFDIEEHEVLEHE